MGYKIVLVDEDGEFYTSTESYDTYDEAEEVIEETLNGSAKYFGDKEIIGGHIEDN